MYPNHYFYHHPYNETASVHSTPFQAEYYNPEVYDQRIFPMFPSQGGPMGPPPGPPGTEGPSQGSQLDRLAHHHHHLFQLKHNNNKLALLQLILVALEDVYSDIRLCG